MQNTNNFLYVMTNPAFPGMVKIGMSKDPVQRRRSLSAPSGVPRPFAIYATLRVPETVTDIQVHNLLGSLRPDLRVNGQREFFLLSPEEAYNLLQQLAPFMGNDLPVRYPSGSTDEQLQRSMMLLTPAEQKAEERPDCTKEIKVPSSSTPPTESKNRSTLEDCSMSDHLVHFSREALQVALRVLTGSGLKLYAALVGHNVGEAEFDLPLTAIVSMGLSRNSDWCTKARQELVDLGFLTLVSTPCTYRFNPLGAPDAGEKAAAKRMKKAARLMKKEGGAVEKRAPARDTEAWEMVEF